MRPISGVYKITNKITCDFYIGSSKNIKQRWAGHKCVSVWKRHPNSGLYKDMVQYSLDNFIFEIIEETTELRNREQYWIDKLNPTYNNYRVEGLNIERHKAWYEVHQKEVLVNRKIYYKANRDKRLDKSRAWQDRICVYNGETMTLNALRIRFYRQGVPHPNLEAKKYLIIEENK